MICTKRDTEMLLTLGRYGVLSTDQLAKKFFPNVALTTVRRRLRLLEKDDAIYRVHGLANGGVAWVLTKNKAQNLGLVHSIKRFSRNSIEHDVTLSEVRNVFESIGLCQTWVPEHVLKIQADIHKGRLQEEIAFVPDAILSVRQKTKTCVIALELELTGKNQKRYENIFNRYLRKKTLWAVWYLVPSESFGKMLERVWKRVNQGRRNDLLIWSEIKSIQANPLTAQVRSEYFSYPLQSLFQTGGANKQPALSGAPPESGKSKGTEENPTQAVF